MLDAVKQLQRRLIEIKEDDDEACLKLGEEYQTLISFLKSQPISAATTTVFSREDISALQQINQVLIERLVLIKNNKKQELKKIRTGKKMQISYLSC